MMNLSKFSNVGTTFILTLAIACVFLFRPDIIFGQEYHGGAIFPMYKGGNQVLKETISKNLNFPDSIKEKGIAGIVTLKLLINKDGKVEYIKLMRGIHPVCDAEAIRVAHLLVDWQPGNHWNKMVDCNVLLPIEFPGNSSASNTPVVISGTVSEIYSGKPVAGAFIYIKGTNIGTLTDDQGNYKLELENGNSEMEVSMMGYNMVTVPIGANRTIHVELEKGYYYLDYRVENK